MVSRTIPPELEGQVSNPVRIYSEDGIPVDVDASQNGLVTLPPSMKWLDLGQSYVASAIFSSVPDFTFRHVLIDIPEDIFLQARIEYDAGGDSVAYLYEGPTVTVNGTAIIPRNRNRRFSDESLVSVFHTPTLTDNGVIILNTLIAGGAGAGAPGADDTTKIYILDGGKKYLLSLLNGSGVTAHLSIAVVWSERNKEN